LATDISEDILAYAQQTAQLAGQDHTRTRVIDGEQDAA